MHLEGNYFFKKIVFFFYNRVGPIVSPYRVCVGYGIIVQPYFNVMESIHRYKILEEYLIKIGVPYIMEREMGGNQSIF
jgi:hypothetical protein